MCVWLSNVQDIATGHTRLVVYSSAHVGESRFTWACTRHPQPQRVGTNTCCWSPPVSSALGDVDQLLDAPRVGQGLGVLHVLAGDLVQGATDGRHRLVGQQRGAAPRETIDQVPHRILSCEGEEEVRHAASSLRRMQKLIRGEKRTHRLCCIHPSMLNHAEVKELPR